MKRARYRHRIIYGSEDPPTAEEILALEDAVGAELPGDFKDFLEVANGGVLYYYEVAINHRLGQERMSFSRIFSTRKVPGVEGEWGTFLGELRSAREAFALPREVLPFALDGGGSILFLDLTEEGRGQVIAYVAGFPAWTGPRQYKFLDVAPSFSDYVDELYVPEDTARELIAEAKNQEDPARLRAIFEWLDISFPDWRNRLGVEFQGHQSEEN
jgi:SMI1 / KNR4 family (SUKH-1)